MVEQNCCLFAKTLKCFSYLQYSATPHVSSAPLTFPLPLKCISPLQLLFHLLYHDRLFFFVLSITPLFPFPSVQSVSLPSLTTSYPFVSPFHPFLIIFPSLIAPFHSFTSSLLLSLHALLVTAFLFSSFFLPFLLSAEAAVGIIILVNTAFHCCHNRLRWTLSGCWVIKTTHHSFRGT